ncbi:MAG: protein kinase, partial [Halieaceae bacterium]|nr:protein kinase [Halieaceae bacterium]
MDQTHQRSVWMARDTHLDRLLTVKRLAGSDRELRSVALLSDIDATSLARVYGVHQHNETHWLLSEFIDGVSLASGDMLWPAQAVLPLLIELTSALVAMADAGVVHCDISPGNVLVDVNGRVRLVDFGIAARAGETVSGAGTPGFAAPEVVAA